MIGVEEGSPTSQIGDNNYPYVGFDDGIKSGNLQDLVLHTRTAGLISKSILILVRFRKIQKSTAQPLQ